MVYLQPSVTDLIVMIGYMDKIYNTYLNLINEIYFGADMKGVIHVDLWEKNCNHIYIMVLIIKLRGGPGNR